MGRMDKAVQVPRGWLFIAVGGVGAWMVVTVFLLLTATSGVAQADQRLPSTPRPGSVTFIKEIGRSSSTPAPAPLTPTVQNRALTNGAPSQSGARTSEPRTTPRPMATTTRTVPTVGPTQTS